MCGGNCSTNNETTGNECPPNNSSTTNCVALVINETICDSDKMLPPLLLTATLCSTSRVVENATIQIEDRRSVYHGVQVDLSSRLVCMQRRRTYLLSFEARIVRLGFENMLVDCSSLGERCLQVYTDFLPGCFNATIQTKLKYEARPDKEVR